MDVRSAFNPLDVLAAAAAWQSEHQSESRHNNHHVTLTNNNGLKTVRKSVNFPIVQWKQIPFLDHAYAYVPRDVVNGDVIIKNNVVTYENETTSSLVNGDKHGISVEVVDNDEVDDTDGHRLKQNGDLVDNVNSQQISPNADVPELVGSNDVENLNDVESNDVENVNDVETNDVENVNDVETNDVENVNDVATNDVEETGEDLSSSLTIVTDDCEAVSTTNSASVDIENCQSYYEDTSIDAKATSVLEVSDQCMLVADGSGTEQISSQTETETETNNNKTSKDCSVVTESEHCYDMGTLPSDGAPQVVPKTTGVDLVEVDLKPEVDVKPEIDLKPEVDVKPEIVNTEHKNISSSDIKSVHLPIPGTSIPNNDVVESTSPETSDVIATSTLTSSADTSEAAKHTETVSTVDTVRYVSTSAVVNKDQVVPALVSIPAKPNGLFTLHKPMTATVKSLVGDVEGQMLSILGPKTLMSPPVLHTKHTCVSIDCCSPSDIGAVSRDMCVDRLSSASSQDLFLGSEDSQDFSPRSCKGELMSPPIDRKPKRTSRSLQIPLGPLLSDAQERPEHPLKDHDYCLHSFYLAVMHNRIEEPMRKPGPAPKCKEVKVKRKSLEKSKRRKKVKQDEDDSDQSPVKEEVFSDSDSLSLDSPCKSRISSPTGSLTSPIDLYAREKLKMREKRLCSLPNVLERDKPRQISNFNDNYVFFGKKPRRRARTLMENNHDKLKKFNHSEFLPGLDSSYLEARAKFHKRSEPFPEVKTELPEFDLNHTSDLQDIPKGGLAVGISEEESQFIDSLHCEPGLDSGFHTDHGMDFTHEQVKELLNVVGVDNALKLIEGTDLHHKDLESLAPGQTTDFTVHGDVKPGGDSFTPVVTGDSTPALGTVTDTTSSVEDKSYQSPRPKDLALSPMKPMNTSIDLGHLTDSGLTSDLCTDLPTPDLHPVHDQGLLSDTGHDIHLGGAVSDLGGTTPELNLGGTTPDLHFGGTTPHDLLDLDDTDLLNANLNLNMNMVLNFQSPEKVYHPNVGRPAPSSLTQRKLDLDLDETSFTVDKSRGNYIRNNPMTLGKPDTMIKSQMFKSLSEIGTEENTTPVQDNGVPELITVNMYWNDLPGLLINGKQYVRLVDIHKQVLPAKPTGLLKNRCRALNLHFMDCSELQRDFLIRYAHAAASRSQIIVTKEVAEVLIGYYVDKPTPGSTSQTVKQRPEEDLDNTSTYSSYMADDDIARLDDLIMPRARTTHRKKRAKIAANRSEKRQQKLAASAADIKTRGRPRGLSSSTCVNVTFKCLGETFKKRVTTGGFALMGAEGSDDEDQSDSDASETRSHKVSAAAVRFQKILALRAQIKLIRAEMYKIQKRQQRADVRKMNGLAKRQRRKPLQDKKIVISYEPKRNVKVTQSVLARNVLNNVNNLQQNTGNVQTVSPFVEQTKPRGNQPLPTVRVAPSVDSTWPVSVQRSASPVMSVSPTPQPTSTTAIVTPITVRSADAEPEIPTVVDDEGVCQDDSTKSTEEVSSERKVEEEPDPLTSSSASSTGSVVIVRAGTDKTPPRLSPPAFPPRSSTPTGTAPSRLAVQHYDTRTHDNQHGFLYLNMFVSVKSSCIRCATCFQQMTVTDFLNHLHSADDGATLIRCTNSSQHRQLLIQDDHLLSPHQTALWTQLQANSEERTIPGITGVKAGSILNKTGDNSITYPSKRTLQHNIQLSRVGRPRSATTDAKLTLTKETVSARPVKITTARSSLPFAASTHKYPTTSPTKSASKSVKSPPATDSSRYSGRVRKRKQFSPDEGYTLPRVEARKIKRSRSDVGLSAKRVGKMGPLGASQFARPVCKVSPRPVAKISPSSHRIK